jgi:hypothetical protein
MTIPALQQLLLGEHAQMRLSLVEWLCDRQEKEATVVLAQRVVFDLDVSVRNAAVAALKDRPQEDFAPVLYAALRYPWAPVVERAAQGLVALNVKGAADQLTRLLHEPDPRAPFHLEKDGACVPVVRELVRVNHLRNCLLCHAPSANRSDLVRGFVPVPGEPLPPSLLAYYSGRGAPAAVVRADVTYLRQDFSVMQPVTDHGKWPARQRYDYLVRTRALTGAEVAAWEKQRDQAAAWARSEYRDILVAALHALSGESPEGTSADRQRSVRDPAARADAVWPVRRDRYCAR